MSLSNDPAYKLPKFLLSNPLLELSIDGAKGILFTVAGGENLGMYEVTEAAAIITQSADPNARIIFGTVLDEALGDEVKVKIIGIDEQGRVTLVRNRQGEILRVNREIKFQITSSKS